MNNKDTPITQEILRVYRLPLRSRGQSPNLSLGKAKFFITYIIKLIQQMFLKCFPALVGYGHASFICVSTDQPRPCLKFMLKIS